MNDLEQVPLAEVKPVESIAPAWLKRTLHAGGLIVAILGSLWPAIVLHFILDLGMGMISWLALRDAANDTPITTESN